LDLTFAYSVTAGITIEVQFGRILLKENPNYDHMNLTATHIMANYCTKELSRIITMVQHIMVA